MSRALRAWLDGFRRVAASPAVVVGVLLVTMAAAAPMAIAMRRLLEDAFGRSLIAGELAGAFSVEWWQEFARGASGLRASFQPDLIGIASTYDTLGDFLDASLPAAPFLAAITVYLGVWVFLTGGILDRYARQRPTRSVGFFSACGVYFFRFLRLGVIAGAAYWWLFAYLHGWLFDDWLDRLTEGATAERTLFAWRLLMYVLFAGALGVVNVWVDYAKVRAVVEDRRSMIGAVLAAFGFIRRHAGRVLALYLLNVVTFLALLALWAGVAPGVGGLGSSMWAGAALTQAYLLARLVLKLHFLASQTALFQASLAHAAYTAAPVPEWPESPAAELIPSGS